MSNIRRLKVLLAALLVVGICAVTLGILPQAAYAQSPSAAKDEAAPTPVPPPPLAAKEEVTNPYGLDALWSQGDFVARGVIVILAIMSLGSWYIMAVRVFGTSRLMKEAKDANATFWKAGSTQQGMAGLKAGTPFRYVAESGVKASERHEGALLEQIDLHTWVSMSMERALDDIRASLQGGLPFLATVGSTAPFIGLFGTVWGIYHALTAIGIAGQASIDKVAGPVGEALIMTAFGLAVAVPAVLGYNWLVSRNKTAMKRVGRFSSELHSVLLKGKAALGRAGDVAPVAG
jgi:biopolymer transport protein ExbB